MWGFRAFPLILLSSLLALSDGAPNCPILGPAFPKPQRPSDNAVIKAAVANLTAHFNGKATDDGQPKKNVSWAIEVWSANEPGLIFSHYHTQTNLDTLNNTGVTKVDANSVFRLGSLTKIYTVLTWLVQDGDIKWTTPITQFVPELREIQDKQPKNAVYRMDWDAVTVGALMSQMSGMPRDYALLGELTQDFTNNEMVYVGFPPLTVAQTPQCGEWPVCNRTEFFATLPGLPPVFPVDSTPAYSNLAYQILAYALEHIKGKNWEDMLRESVLGPLGLQHTYYSMPNNSQEVGVIPGNFTETGWANYLGEESPAGSMYSSAADMTKLGRAILSSSLIPPAMTRRWLKPVSFTADPQAGLGTPWGVRKIPLGHPYRYVYAFQKAGTIKGYSALMILLPDYDVGFTILMAGAMPRNFNFESADAIGEALIPALEEAGRAEAAARYAGMYTSSDPAVNSSMTIAADDLPGLAVTSWTSNGTDMQLVAVLIQLQTSGPVTPSIRLYPTLLEQTRPDGGRTSSWKAVFENLDGPDRRGKFFSTDCASWLQVTSEQYGALPLDEFVFNADAKGKVESVEPIALRRVMNKV